MKYKAVGYKRTQYYKFLLAPGCDVGILKALKFM